MRKSFSRRSPLLFLIYPAVVAALTVLLQPARSQDSDRPWETDTGPKGLTVFFIGSRLSEIEPCGCTKNQLGGMQYEMTLYEDVERELSIRVDVGGWSSARFNPEETMRIRYGLRAMGGLLDLDAVNFARPELALGRATFEDLGEKYPEAIERIISANVAFRKSPNEGELAFKPYRIIDRKLPDGSAVKVGITGVTTGAPLVHGNLRYRNPDANPYFIIKDRFEAVNSVIEEIRDDVDLFVVLFHGSWAETAQFAATVPEVDLIISPSRPKGSTETYYVEGDTTVLSVRNIKGKHLGRADIVKSADSGWRVEGDPQWLRVDPKTLYANEEIVDLIADFKANTKELLVDRPRGTKRIYANASSCASCHLAEYQSWRSSRHAFALTSLVEKGSQFDSNCLKCHTLSFQKDNGFWNYRQSLKMGEVQCENCHGPGRAHSDHQNLIRNGTVNTFDRKSRKEFMKQVKATMPERKVAESLCIQCHTAENDPNFDYKTKLKLVDHAGAIERLKASKASKAKAAKSSGG